MKILLVQSPAGRREVQIFPIGLAFLAGQLNEHDVKGLDLSLYPDFIEVFKKELISFEPDVVGISLRNIDDSSYPVTYSYVTPFSKIIEVLQDWEGTVIAGGTGFSIYPEIILDRFPRIDYGLPGEGEKLFPELIDNIQQGSVTSWLNGSRILPWGMTDLDDILSPDYSFLDIAPYSAVDAIGVQSRRGCEFNCTYCTYSYLSGKKFRERPVAHVLNDIRILENLGISRFQFIDSIFNSPEEYFEELLSSLISSDNRLSWSAWIDEKITPAQLARMKLAGAVKVDFSPDAISDSGLTRLGKRGKAADLLPAVKAARAEGLQVGINFFNGNPGEGFGSFIRKLGFMLRVRLTLGRRETFVNIGTIRVYAHSPISLQMINEGLVEKDCDFFDPVFFITAGPADWLYRTFQRVKKMAHPKTGQSRTVSGNQAVPDHIRKPNGPGLCPETGQSRIMSGNQTVPDHIRKPNGPGLCPETNRSRTVSGNQAVPDCVRKPNGPGLCPETNRSRTVSGNQAVPDYVRKPNGPGLRPETETVNYFKLGLAGWPLSLSLSPFIHSEFLGSCGLHGEYRLYPVVPERFKTEVSDLIRRGVVGLNVTYPHKKAAVRICDEIVGKAVDIGVINTINRIEGKTLGYNTDIVGFDSLFSRILPPEPFYIVGGGSVALTVDLVLSARGAVSEVFTRAPDEWMGIASPRRLDEIESEMLRVNGGTVINTTTLGWKDDDSFPVDAGLFKGRFFIDLNYNRFWKWRNLLSVYTSKVFTGEIMLVFQAAEAFRIWTGILPETKNVLRSVREKLEQDSGKVSTDEAN